MIKINQHMVNNFKLACIIISSTIVLFSCNNKKTNNQAALFEVLDSNRTGIEFSNNLTYKKDFNLFLYMYFYNGSGVGAGDFNNDGLIDLFFGSNQGDNKLYLNKGQLHFSDVTRRQLSLPMAAGLPAYPL